ncbi:oligosaccharide flippase family protein [Croceimicrobium sp.]|uniref:oligosaccharide flippase family protein n=1 Tax=Croceimicrobium sp. TaxID=2828340 RepID=UPI003BA9AC3E
MQRLGRNIGFMGLSQAANYLLPLVTLPFITRIVGPDNYGLIEFATVTVLYFSALVTYGFTFTGTRKIAELGESHHRISKVYSVVMQSKLLLLLISTLLFVLLLFLVPEYSTEKKLMIFAFPFVIGWGLYPDFLFQGRQDLGVIALANLGIKTVGAILILSLLREPADYPLVVGINSLTQIIAAAITLWYAHYRYKWLRFQWQAWRMVKAYLKSGFYIFASHFFTRVYTFGSILFLGFILAERELGLFAAAMKLITVGQSFLFTPVGSSLYPHLAQKLKENPASYFKERRRFLGYLLGLSALLSIVLIIGQDFWVRLLFGAAYQEAAPALALMAPVMVFTALSHFGMKQGLMVLKADGWNFRIVLITGLASIAFNYFFIQWMGMIGAAWAKLALEALLAILSLYYFQKAVQRFKR